MMQAIQSLRRGEQDERCGIQ